MDFPEGVSWSARMGEGRVRMIKRVETTAERRWDMKLCVFV